MTLYAEHGEVWYTEGGANIKRMLPCTVEEGDLLYWVPDLSEHATLTMTLGDESVTFQYADGKMETESFRDIVEQARLYILVDHKGSFEHFAEWGLIAPKAW